MKYVADCGLLFIKYYPVISINSTWDWNIQQWNSTCSCIFLWQAVVIIFFALWFHPLKYSLLIDIFYLFYTWSEVGFRTVLGEDHWHIHGHSFSIEQTFNLFSNVDKDTDTDNEKIKKKTRQTCLQIQTNYREAFPRNSDRFPKNGQPYQLYSCTFRYSLEVFLKSSINV